MSLQAFPGGLPGFRQARIGGGGGADGGQGGEVGLEMSWAQGRATRALVYRRLP